MIVAENNCLDTDKLANEKIADGEVCFSQGDMEGAVEAFRSVLEFDPENARANSNLGVVLWQTEDHQNALIHLKCAYTADPDDKVALTNLAQVYLALQQEQNAMRLYTDFLDRHPEEDDIRRILSTQNLNQKMEPENQLESKLLEHAEKLQRINKTSEAMQVLEVALTLASKPLEVHKTLGKLYRHSGQYGKAIEHLTKASRLDPRDPITTLHLSESFCESKSYEAAIHTCSAYLTFKPENQEITELLEKYKALDVAKKAAISKATESKKCEDESIIARVPEMDNTLNALSALGVEVKAILDVGVLRGTPQLMKKFPDLKHYLFEPIDDHFDQIRRNYSHLNFELIHVALSSEDGEAWQHNLCNDGSGRITHSQIADKPGNPEKDPGLIKSERVPMARLDTLIGGMKVATPYLLKLDVDGHEIPILEGARETLKNANVVVIEATARTFLDRANFLADEGFILFDIVDFAYYSGVLHQVDIIFIRKEVHDSNDRLRPMRNLVIKPSHWYQVSANYFEK